MKKFFLLFVPFFLFISSSFVSLACERCSSPDHLTFHYTKYKYDPCGCVDIYFDPSSVSAPVYCAYTIYGGTSYLLVWSSTPFRCSALNYTGGDDNVNWASTNLYDLGDRKIMKINISQHYFSNFYSLPGSFLPVNLTLPNIDDSTILSIDTTKLSPVLNSDGSIYQPPSFDPVSDVHDFTKDVYDPNLSVPVLSNVSYTGFSIDNPDGKEWQVVVDGRVFGLKWNPSYTDPMLLTNTNYTVNHQIWNFADHPDKISLNGRFDVYDNFGVSTYDWFVSQVKQYANDVHPSDYPNYSFLKVGLKTGWNTFLDYIKDIGSDEAENPDGAGHRFEQNIYRSRMCQVTYYVRFVEYDSAGDPHYSRWMAYTLKPSQDVLVEGENFSRGNVEFGEVTDVDSVTGRPVVSEKENLKYNTDTGEYEYYDPLSNQGFQFEMNDVFGYLSGLKESVMGFADLIAYCFSFLPSWVSQFISYSLVVAISFSVIRLIRG